MEHLSRRTTTDVDVLVIVAEPTAVSLRSARRVAQTAESLPIAVRRKVLVVNRVGEDGISPVVERQVAELGLEVGGIVPQDQVLVELAEIGAPITEAPADSPALAAVEALVEEWLPAASDAGA